MPKSICWIFSNTDVVVDGLLRDQDVPGSLRDVADDLDDHADEEGPKLVAECRRIFEAKNVEIFREEDCIEIENELEEQCTSLNSVDKRNPI